METSFISHIIELRKRIIHILICILIVFLALVWNASGIYDYLSAPLINRLPDGANMIATGVASPFLTPMKLTFVVAIFLSIPYILHQIWGFIAPGLYQHERKLIYPLLISSSMLFYCGIAFAYYIVFPLIFKFLTAVAPQNVMIATDISSYLDFVLTIFFAFGLAFEIPIAIILLCWSGVTDRHTLQKKRPYVIVILFTVGMLLTPPDVISQTLLAVPMYLLFEIGLFFSRFYQSDT